MKATEILMADLNRTRAELSAVREENVRLREALETARCALDSPTFPSLNGSETAKAVRDALAAPTPEKGAECVVRASGSVVVDEPCETEDWSSGVTPEHPEREDSTPNAPKVTERECICADTQPDSIVHMKPCPVHATPPCGGTRCWWSPDEGAWIHSSKSYSTCSRPTPEGEK